MKFAHNYTMFKQFADDLALPNLVSKPISGIPGLKEVKFLCFARSFLKNFVQHDYCTISAVFQTDFQLFSPIRERCNPMNSSASA